MRWIAALILLFAPATVAPASTPGPPPCRTPQLGLALRSTGVATGNAFANVVLTNTSKTACTLRGYPRVQLVGAGGRARPTHVSHVGMWGADHVVSVPLAPGRHASFSVQYSITPTGHGACPLVTLRVTPPGATASRLVRPPVVDCAGGRIWVSAVHPGTTGVLG